MLAYKPTPTNFMLPSNRNLSLSEAYGANDPMPEFAIMAADGRQIGNWMRCKDYIQDCVWGSKMGRSYEVYGWNYDPKVDPRVSDKWLILAMRWKNKTPEELDKGIANVKATVENLETRLKVPKYQRTRFSRRINDYFIMYGGENWLRAPALVSLFTWMTRASLTNDGQTFDSLMKMKKFVVRNDGYYIRQGKVFVDELLEKGFEGIPSDWNKYTEAYNVHGNGFVGAARTIAQQKGIKLDYAYDYDDDGF
jgi:hypothetical protein